MEPSTAELANKIMAGASGSAIAAWIAKATGLNLLVMFLSGFATSYFLGPALSEFFNLHKQEAAVGFVVGFLAILVMRKVVAVIEAVSGESVGRLIVDWLKKRLGV